ncbi:MAG TPA: RNA polymerase factor sigma-54 [Clostridia bacterium]|nr:RNA polymerase factor sigma-54 [Clostridia bacterium]
MRMSIGLNLEQTQKLIITPELRQAIAILQLSSLELSEFLQQELLENPVLEMGEETEEAAAVEEVRVSGEEDLFDEIDWQEYFADGRDLGYTGMEETRTEESSFEQFVSEDSTLHEHLMMQLHLSRADGRVYAIGEFLIGNIDDNGYLRITLEDAAAQLDCSPAEVEEVLRLIQDFDPPGVGARNLAECLLIQFHYLYGQNPLAESIILHHLQDLGEGRLTKIAKALNITPNEVQYIGDLIRTLDPKPGRRFGSNLDTRYIVPDVVVEKVAGEYVILVNDYIGSRLRINSHYRDLLGQGKPCDEETKRFLESKLNSALWIIKSIEQRRLTLYRVVKTIVSFQRDFMEYGIKHLKPLTLRQVAEALGLHESTVSRAIANKYVQTPQGVYELKFFFASGVEKSGGQGVAAESVKKILQELIAKEDPANPLTDQALTDILTRQGLRISRRTVAKYRDEMGIPSANRRKRF